jgi:hypothetical protein
MQTGETMECAGEMGGIAEASVDGSLGHGASCKDIRCGTEKSSIENIGAKRKTQLIGEEVQKSVLRKTDVPSEIFQGDLTRQLAFDPIERGQYTFVDQNTRPPPARQGVNQVFGFQKHLRTLGRVVKSAAKERNERKEGVLCELSKRLATQKAIIKMAHIPCFWNHMQGDPPPGERFELMLGVGRNRHAGNPGPGEVGRVHGKSAVEGERDLESGMLMHLQIEMLADKQ